MTVTVEYTVPITGRNVYSGLSSDLKPTDSKAGSEFYETDTGIKYEFDGVTWSNAEVYGAQRVTSSPNFVGTAAECQTHADLLSSTDVGVYTFFASDTNQYGTLSAYAGGTGTITWETTDGASHVRVSSSALLEPLATYYDDAVDFTTAASPYTTAALALYGDVIINITGLSTGTITVTGLIGANMDVETTALLPYDANDGALHSTTAIATNGTYVFRNIPVKKLKLTASTTEGVVTIGWVA